MSVDQFTSPQLLALGPLPKVAAKDHEELRVTSLADMIERFNRVGISYDVQSIRSNSGAIVTETAAWRTMHRLREIDAAVERSYIRFSHGPFLEERAKERETPRMFLPHNLVAQAPEARPTNVPPKWTWDAEAFLWREDDDSLKGRAQLAWEKLSVAGPGGAYVRLAADAHPMVDVNTTIAYGPQSGKCQRGEILVVIQSHAENGIATNDVIDSVAEVLDAALIVYANGARRERQVRDDYMTRPMCAYVILKAARPRLFAVRAHLLLQPRPDPAMVRAGAIARVTAYAASVRAVGIPAPCDAIKAALHVPDVNGLPTINRVQQLEPTVDLIPAADEFLVLSRVDITSEVG